MTLRPLMLFAALCGAGCAALPKPELPALRVPDFSSWFAKEHVIEVADVGRSIHCGGDSPNVRVGWLPDLASTQAWAKAHDVELPGSEEGQLLDAPYAIVELGYRPTGGFGIAVARQAGFKDNVLVLKATFFEPGPGRWANTDPTSPCAVISLPPRTYGVIKLIDQSGALRATVE